MSIKNVADAFFGNVPDSDLFVFCASCKVFAVWGEADAADIEVA
jgi:hypothetical protein